MAGFVLQLASHSRRRRRRSSVSVYKQSNGSPQRKSDRRYYSGSRRWRDRLGLLKRSSLGIFLPRTHVTSLHELRHSWLDEVTRRKESWFGSPHSSRPVFDVIKDHKSHGEEALRQTYVRCFGLMDNLIRNRIVLFFFVAFGKRDGGIESPYTVLLKEVDRSRLAFLISSHPRVARHGDRLPSADGERVGGVR